MEKTNQILAEVLRVLGLSLSRLSRPYDTTTWTANQWYDAIFRERAAIDQHPVTAVSRSESGVRSRSPEMSRSASHRQNYSKTS